MIYFVSVSQHKNNLFRYAVTLKCLFRWFSRLITIIYVCPHRSCKCCLQCTHFQIPQFLPATTANIAKTNYLLSWPISLCLGYTFSLPRRRLLVFDPNCRWNRTKFNWMGISCQSTAWSKQLKKVWRSQKKLFDWGKTIPTLDILKICRFFLDCQVCTRLI